MKCFGFGRTKRPADRQGGGTRGTTVTPANPGLEPLEQRLLLSGVGVGVLPTVDQFEDQHQQVYDFHIPDPLSESNGPQVSGRVFHDYDKDGLQDLNEPYAEGVRVYADADNNGRFTADETGYLLGRHGDFNLWLPVGDHVIRLDLPDGYKPTTGLEGELVTITSASGVTGLQIGIAPTGFDLELVYSDVSMPAVLKTGTHVKAPLILTNLGDLPMQADDLRLRVWLSEDAVLEKNEDTRLESFVFNGTIAPGESVRLELEFRLPDALADFTSYMLVDTAGQTSRADFNPTNNLVVSDKPLRFKASTRARTIEPAEQTVVLSNWIATTPYGGYEPGSGFVGLQDLNVVLGNWKGGGTITTVGGGTINIAHPPLEPPAPPSNTPGQPGSITGRLSYNYPKNELDYWIGISIGPPLVGWTVYLDQNRNGVLDDGELSALTDADGMYHFADLPTYTNDSIDRMTYYITVDHVPDGWRSVGGSDSFGVHVRDGQMVEYADFSFYAPPVVGSVVMDTQVIKPGQLTTLTATGVSDSDGRIEGVYFYNYNPADQDRVVKDLIGVDFDGSDGYSVTIDGSFGQRGTGYASVFAVAIDDGGHFTAVKAETTYEKAVDVSAGRGLMLRESDGTVVKITMDGPGTARISLRDEGGRIFDLGETFEIVGGAVIGDIHLSGTNGRSRLNIQSFGSNAGKRSVKVTGALTGSGYLGTLNAPSVNFSRGINLTGDGVIRTIRAERVDGIVMPGKRPARGVTLTVQKLMGYVRLGSGLRVLNAHDISHARITTPYAERVMVQRHMRNSSLSLTDEQATLGLGLLSVGNQMDQVSIRSNASIGTIRTRTLTHTNIQTGGLVAVGDGTQKLLAFNYRTRIGLLHITGGTFESSYISAWRIRSLIVNAPNPAQQHQDTSSLLYHRMVQYRGPAQLVMRSDYQLLSSPKAVFTPLVPR